MKTHKSIFAILLKTFLLTKLFHFISKANNTQMNFSRKFYEKQFCLYVQKLKFSNVCKFNLYEKDDFLENQHSYDKNTNKFL